MNINEHLAIKVMGWYWGKPNRTKHGVDWAWLNSKDEVVHKAFWNGGWNPLENIEQAMMCLGTFDGWLINKEDEIYEVCIQDPYYMLAQNKSLPKAISLASARATGWEDK